MKITLNILFMFVLLQSSAQNLVPNPSFEDYSGCPFMINDVTNFAANWKVFNPTPDFFHVCASNSQLGVPLNHAGWQNAATGNGYGGVYVYTSTAPVNNREYLGIQLTSALVTGTTYYTSMKVSLANYSSFAVSHMGMLLTTQAYCVNYNPPPTTCNAPNFELLPYNFSHIYSENIISDTANWVQIYGQFVADSAYEYLSVGVFFEDNLISKQNLGGLGYNSFYYVDDVCISSDPDICFSESSVGLIENEIISKSLLRIVDIYGRETKEEPNKLLIYIYNDGSVTKVYRIE